MAAKKPRNVYQEWKSYGLPEPTYEHRFHETRRWRFDFAWPDHKIAVEQDGGLWVSGRHSRAAGRLGDYEKDLAAMLLGWRVGRFSVQQVRAGDAARWVEQMLVLCKSSKPCGNLTT